jgi:C-terminal processing protease CtpA/Prc
LPAAMRTFRVWWILVCLSCLAQPAAAQEMTGRDRERNHIMLRAVEDDLRRFYYDTTFNGLDLTALFDSADARITAAESNSEAFLTIALALNALRDSHTFFFPPRFTTTVQYGWNLGLVGDSCYILKVDPESDAAARGVRPGDRVIAVDRFAATRSDRWNLQYFYNVLAPRSSVRLTLQGPGDSVRNVVAQAEVTTRPFILDLTHGEDIWRLIRERQSLKRTHRSRFAEFGTDVLVWRLPSFTVGESEIDRSVRRAQGFKGLVIDLREDPGGFETTLLRLAGNLVGVDTIGGPADAQWDGAAAHASRRASLHRYRGGRGRRAVRLSGGNARLRATDAEAWHRGGRPHRRRGDGGAWAPA